MSLQAAAQRFILAARGIQATIWPRLSSTRSIFEMTRGPGAMPFEIIAGSTTDINKDSGQWLIVDIGFSSTECSCGIWKGSGKPCVTTFGNLVKLVTHAVQKAGTQPLNLLIEAPLSVAFQKDGNPTRRSCDSQGGKHRDWYVNAGATTLIAAGYLLRALHGCRIQRDVRLFEGFISFKPSEAKPSKTRQIG